MQINTNIPNLPQKPNTQSNFQPVPMAEDDIESGGQSLKNDYQQSLRMGFIRKVYGILSGQLLLTFLFCCLSMTSTKFAKFQLTNPGLMIICMLIDVVLLIFLMCNPNSLKKVPQNYIFLAVFTLCESYIVSAICAGTNPRLVFMAASMTIGMTLILTYYACTTKEDFTVMGASLFIGISVLFLFSFFFMFTHNTIIHILLCCASMVIYSVYLVYDTQLLLGNKMCALDYDDYIIGAMMLYVDIIQLFLNLLEILQYAN